MFLGCLAEDVLVLHKHFLITTAIITSSNTPPEAEAPILTQFDGLFCGAAVTRRCARKLDYMWNCNSEKERNMKEKGK